MRALGHLEIETDSKGHLIRVHACEPVIYEVLDRPDRSPNRYRITGSFTRLVLENLLETEEIELIVENDAIHLFLESIDRRAVSDLVRKNGFSLVSNPAHQLLSWAGSIEEFREHTSSKSLAERKTPSNLERFNPQHALFSRDDTGSMKVDEERKVELFRLDDPVIPMMRAYMLGAIDEFGSARYSYIVDSRWAVWLAFSSFLNFAKAFSPKYTLGRFVMPWIRTV